jgi:hypothetical protein
MKSLSIPAVLSLLPLLSVVGSTQAKPSLDQQLHESQPEIAEVNEAPPAPETPAAIAAPPKKAEQPMTQAEQPTTQAEQPKSLPTAPLYNPEDPRYGIHDNCPACGMG